MTEQACPVNYKQINAYLIKFYSTIVAAILMMYLFAGWKWPVYFLAVDFFIRITAGIRYSPLCIFLNTMMKYLNIKPREVDASTKVFAARVGFMFSLLLGLSVFLHWHLVSLITGTVFLLAVLAEVMLDFCVACYLESLFIKKENKKQSGIFQ